MKINNDVVAFDVSDFSGLSPFAQKALAVYYGGGVQFFDVFSKLINAELSAASKVTSSETAVQVNLQELSDLLAKADPSKFAAAVTQIDAVKAGLK